MERVILSDLKSLNIFPHAWCTISDSPVDVDSQDENDEKVDHEADGEDVVPL